ncbi:hypothetical protein HPP92_016845 [Vanilla planifolia]|uniref:aldehyde oxygenase (deformylating) n=1 Tax=Vanilla planifolia TaxID=51239 RepID=A0A835UR18_VANPL|nr:hypothetical protein HPP92_017453 [Vanilla planifolia]KAG0472299.1 hypothetical protein HPP92_016845 [Vanilla planifolia]
MPAPLSSWPWVNLGSFKYLLYGPLVAKAIGSRAWDGGRPEEFWSLHLLFLFALRALVHQLWWSFSSLLFLTRKRLIIKKGIDFKQIDREWDWDNFLITQSFIGAFAFYFFPSLRILPLWDLKGLFVVVFLHMMISEPVFYWAHRAFHGKYLFNRYHYLHHSSPTPSSFTAGHGTPMEHLVMSLVMGFPLLGATLVGAGSIGLFYVYVLLFDFLRCMGHSNVEIFPSSLFESFSLLRYLIYTPTYHSLHHTEKNSNYCLFMPLFDALGGTINAKSWSLHKEISSGKNTEVPDFVFLAHVVDIVSSLHAPFVFRSFSSLPFRVLPWIVAIWPGGFFVMLMMWVWSKTFLFTSYSLRGRLHQYWIVPRHGFQYFLPFAKDGINKQIESAILRADRLGVKVLSLAALNKNEALNGVGLCLLTSILI